MARISSRRLNDFDDWPPIIGIRLDPDASSADLKSALRRDFRDARLIVTVESGGLSEREVTRIASPLVQSVTVETQGSGPALPL